MSITSAIFKLVKKLPFRLAIIFCQFVIFTYLSFQKQYRKEILINYQKIFGAYPPLGIWFWLRLAFRLGNNFGVMVKMGEVNKKILDKTLIYGENILYNYKKAIIVSFHYGLWELLPQIFQRLGYKTYIAASVQADKSLESELFRYRSQNGVKLIKTISEMKHCLKQSPPWADGAKQAKGILLGFVLDNTRKTKRLCLSEPYPNFFILRTPFVLAKLAKVPILSMFCYQRNNQIVVDIDEVKSPAMLGKRLRNYLKRSPEDWIFWGKQ